MKRIALLSLFLLSFSIHFGQTEKEKVIETVNKSTIEGHIYFLADDVLKGRETGTPENKIAASYLANTLRGYGVKPSPVNGTYYQTFQLEKVTPPQKMSMKINNITYSDFVAIQPAGLNFKGDAIYMGYGLEDDYAKANVKGKLVLIDAGSPTTKDTRDAFDIREKKAKLAEAAGAAGLVEFVDTNENIWNFIQHDFNSSKLSQLKGASDPSQKLSSFTHIWALNPNGGFTKKMKPMKDMLATVQVDAAKKSRVTTQNVIGVVEGTDPKLKNEYIIYSAHYDHVGVGTPDETGDTIYNGARDNAIGTTTVLSMAANLAKYPTKRSALFILFTGEEKGLLGSEYYVEHPVLPLKQMVFCFNSDNGGYNDTSLATIIGLPRTTAAANIKAGVSAFGLTAIDDPAPEQGLFDRSDNVHFAAKGIPAPTFSLGFTAFNGDVTKYYHRPGDHADNLDYDYLEKFFRAYVMTGRIMGNDPVTPVWTSGDKYEEISKALYKN